MCYPTLLLGGSCHLLKRLFLWYVMVILQMGEDVLIHFKLGRTNPRTK